MPPTLVGFFFNFGYFEPQLSYKLQYCTVFLVKKSVTLLLFKLAILHVNVQKQVHAIFLPGPTDDPDPVHQPPDASSADWES